MVGKEHCCDAMARYIDPNCAQHPNPRDCEDALISYDARFDSYGLMARMGAQWDTMIKFYPWCGDAKRDLTDAFFDRLDAMGLEPQSPDLPAKFKDATWWQEEGL